MKAFRTTTGGVYHISEDGNTALCGKTRNWSAHYNREYETLSSESRICKACQKAHAGVTVSSDKQQRRQTTRDNSGQYSAYETCEVCNERPAEYYSDVYECSVCEECSKHEHDNEPEPPAKTTPEQKLVVPHDTWTLMVCIHEAMLTLQLGYKKSDDETVKHGYNLILKHATKMTDICMASNIFEGKKMHAEATGLDRGIGALESVKYFLDRLPEQEADAVGFDLTQAEMEIRSALMNSIIGWTNDYKNEDYNNWSDNPLFRQYRDMIQDNYAKHGEMIRKELQRRENNG